MCNGCYISWDSVDSETSLAETADFQVQKGFVDTENKNRPSGIYIVNGLLSYTQFYLSKSPIENIKTVLCRFYGHTEIKDAKNLLWECIDNELLGLKQARCKQ